MSKLKDLTGQRFGRLTVIKRAENDKHNRPTWLCRCDCGNEKIISSVSLQKQKSCGCLRSEKSTLKRGENVYRLGTVATLRISSEKYGAKDFLFDIEDYERERAEKKLLKKLQEAEEAVKDGEGCLSLEELKAAMGE